MSLPEFVIVAVSSHPSLELIDSRLHRRILFGNDDQQLFGLVNVLRFDDVRGRCNDEDEDEEGGEEKPDTKIVAEGLIFPILCHEIIKGLEEAKGRHGYPKDPKLANKVLN
mgnify:CR=1 FL=1